MDIDVNIINLSCHFCGSLLKSDDSCAFCQTIHKVMVYSYYDYTKSLVWQKDSSVIFVDDTRTHFFIDYIRSIATLIIFHNLDVKEKINVSNNVTPASALQKLKLYSSFQ